MRIAAVFDPMLANAVYRSMVPMAALQRRGHEVKAFEQSNGEPRIPLDELARYDVVHVHRTVVNNDDRYVDALHEAGAAVWFDDDDDADAVTADMWEQLHGEVTVESIDRILAEHARARALLPAMDLVTTPSEVLAERMRGAGARDVRIIDNYLPPELLRIRPVGREGFIIGWLAGREHRWDRDAMEIVDALRQILERHPHVNVITIGLPLDLDSNRYTHVEGVPFRELTNHLADFDIGIAPLADHPFSQGRSAVKLREYAAAGVPWLASPVGAYRRFGKAQGGRLVADDEWVEALDDLIRSPLQRTLARRRAKGWVRGELIDKTIALWEAPLFDVAEARRVA